MSGGAKEAARAEVRSMLEVLPDNCPPVYVRINSPVAGFLEQDLTALVPQALAGIMLPKAETCDQVTQVAAALDKLEGGQTDPLELLLLVETAVGIRNSYELASSSSRVSRLVFGAVDYSLDLGVSLSVSSEAMAYAQCKLVVDSRAAGLLPPVDTV